MSAEEEFESFVTTFRALWKTGKRAKLTVTTSHEKAWVNLNVGLGRHQDLPPQPAEGSERQRWRERREGNRAKVAEDATEGTGISVTAEGTDLVNKEKDEPKAAGRATEQVVHDEFCPDTVYSDESSKVVKNMMIRTTSWWGKYSFLQCPKFLYRKMLLKRMRENNLKQQE